MTARDPETIEVRSDELLDTIRLEPYLRERLPEADGALTVEQFGGGHANLTYLLRFGDVEYVLRRPPLGPVAPSAHDMRREHSVQSVLYEAYPLCPRSFLFCDDHSIIGADFHVSERRRGFVIRTEMPERFLGNPELNRRIGNMLVDALAGLHAVQPAAVGLGDFGRPEGFVQRQLDGWTQRWHAARDTDIAEIDTLIDWLAADVPAPQAATLLHNDFKMDNVLVDSTDPATPVAVLDWDMCTRGDPLMDLGHMLNYWSDRDDPLEWRSVSSMPTWGDGFPTRRDVIERYGERTGFDTSRADWYFVFGVFKLAVILQQIYIRYLRGQTRDERFASFGERIAGLARKGNILINNR
ncbi:MAG: phosphotransferase family protein [Rhodospirillales bacterium]|nr:phosphotransferase family protein [Rhodospirillales bacterium]MCW8971264.1 phosphotransferase family protein [Rhodospirillales bacterium]MCW9003159.1 phosphotransferase family protein [Rhodospirillales bacterium]